MLTGKCTSEAAAVTILQEKVNLFCVESLPSQAKYKSPVTKPMVKRTLLSLSKGDETDSTAQEADEQEIDCVLEISSYLRESQIPEESSPLQYWKENEQKYPRLAKLAKIYLGIPASSGSVERLFSVAGALARARRARLKVSTIETLLFRKELQK